MSKLQKLNRLKALKNARTVAHLTVLSGCSEELVRAKSQLQLAGLAPRWENFERSADYPAMMAGINADTIARLRQLWEDIKL